MMHTTFDEKREIVAGNHRALEHDTFWKSAGLRSSNHYLDDGCLLKTSFSLLTRTSNTCTHTRVAVSAHFPRRSRTREKTSQIVRNQHLSQQ